MGGDESIINTMGQGRGALEQACSVANAGLSMYLSRVAKAVGKQKPKQKLISKHRRFRSRYRRSRTCKSEPKLLDKF